MTLRYLRRKKVQILVILLLISVTLFWTNFQFTGHLLNRQTNCKSPCYGVTCKSCSENYIPDIFDKLNLKKALRVAYINRIDDTHTHHVCKRPAFDLLHDSVKYAFHSMGKLNCTRKALFSVENGIFKIDQSVLKDTQLERCVYYGIERVTDDFSTYTEGYTKDKVPFDLLIIKQDFVRVKCFIKTSESPQKLENEDNDIELDISGRKTLSIRKLLHHSSNILNTKTNFDIPKSNNHKHFISNSLHKPHLFEAVKSYSEQRSTDKQNERIKSTKVLDNNKYRLPVYSRSNVTDSDLKYQIRKLQQDVRAAEIDNTHQDDTDNNDHDQYIPDDVELDQNYSSRERYDYYDLLYRNNFEVDEPDFDQFLVQVYPKPEVFQRISEMKVKPHEDRMNVLVFGLDSMSHLAFQRKLPKSYQFLKDVLGSVVLDGYNIVGDATTANLVPMLTGHTETELPETRKSRYNSVSVSNYPMIWNDFRHAGYVTMFAEDEPSIGAFNLRLTGFDKQPTDHYMRPFWQALWDSEIRKSSPRYCTGDKQNHMFLLDYTKDFFVKYENVSKFAFVFGSELTHWDNNPGEYMDQDFVDFLQFLSTKGYLNNTLLVVMADHGARYSRVRKTVQGKMEERLPIMSLAFPSWFSEKRPLLYKNLVRNSDHLATPFDIYETLRDILDLKRTEVPVNLTNRGLSLLSRIPADRTCSNAHVQMHWCTCIQQLELDHNSDHVRHSAGELIRVLNEQTSELRDRCAMLKLKKIISANLLIPNEKVLMFQRSKDDDNRVANFSRDINVDHAHFQITVETSPNRGLFEATVQVNMTSGSYTVMEDISRIDMYGNQPRCIEDKYPEMRKFCYCNDNESRDKNRQGRLRKNAGS